MSKEAMKQAFEALEYLTKPLSKGWDAETQKVKRDAAITSLRQAIAEAEKQEPYVDVVSHWHYWMAEADKYRFALENATKREPLRIEKLREHWQVAKVLDMTDSEIDFADYVLIARDVEALHGIKGEA